MSAQDDDGIKKPVHHELGCDLSTLSVEDLYQVSMIEIDCVGPEAFIRREAYRRAMLRHRSRIATKSVKDVRPIRRTGRFWLPDVVENPRRTDGSGCGFLLAGNQNRSGAIASYHRHLVLDRRVTLLREEILRLEAEKQRKQAGRQAAESLFKR